MWIRHEMLLQLQNGVQVDIDLPGALGGGAAGAFVSTLIFGAVLVALAPDYTIDRMNEVVTEPLDNFWYGVFIILALVVMSVALVITIVGILVVIPLLIAAYVAWAVGSAIAFLVLAVRLLERFDGGGSRERPPAYETDHATDTDTEHTAAHRTDRPVASDGFHRAEIDWLKALLVAGVLDAGLVMTGIGALIALGIGAIGFGAVVRKLLV